MDISKFTENKTGQLVESTGIPGIAFSFVPDPLPPKWKWQDNLWPLLLEARVALSKLDGIGKYLPNPNLLLRPLQNREAIRSSSLEGTYATPEQLLLFQIDPDYQEPNKAEIVNEFREVNNYVEALSYHFESKSKLPLSLRLLKQLHKILLSNVRGEKKQPGEFRRLQNQIGQPARYVPPPPDRLMECLDNFEKYLYQKPAYDPLVNAFIVHYQFETIHPFLDGNGRIGRLLLSITIKEWCDLSNQWLYMSAFFDSHRDDYIDKLFAVSSNGEWGQWIEFCLRGVVDQAKDTVSRCEKLLQLSEDFEQRIKSVNGNFRQSAIAKQLFVKPFVQVPYIAKTLGITYPTAEADIEKLVQAKILTKSNYAKKKTYFSSEILGIAYD